ncbi:polysaccharide lyase beta-sandwich domain-containing protein [Streptomyces sp. WG7]|uniref:polysaccharide lyase beta-sandwich domain-containing protein n=1 Tax=Streptomyces sp. WG7 TaxID=3417650 RepID=UPI003CEB306E
MDEQQAHGHLVADRDAPERRCTGTAVGPPLRNPADRHPQRPYRRLADPAPGKRRGRDLLTDPLPGPRHGPGRRRLRPRPRPHAGPHGFTVRADDDRCRAAEVPPLGRTAANFWQAGTAGPLTTTAGAGVLIHRRGRTATLCVSGPPRTREPVEALRDRPVRTAARAGGTVEIRATGRRLHLRVTPGVVCTTHECEVTLS